MIELVTLQEASDHLRRDTNADDGDLILKIQGASQAVLNYLKNAPYYYLELDSNGESVLDSNEDPVPEFDSNGFEVIRPEVKAATLLLLGEFYKNREGMQEGEIDPQFGYGYLPRPVVALLYPLRDPALA